MPMRTSRAKFGTKRCGHAVGYRCTCTIEARKDEANSETHETRDAVDEMQRPIGERLVRGFGRD